MDDEEEAVGYGRPPKANRFKPGQSGNPKGRPKGRLSFQTQMMNVLNMKVVITDKNGRKRSISMVEAAGRKLTQKAMQGDHRALEAVLGYAERFDADPASAADPTDPQDRALIDEALSRLARGNSNDDR